MTSRRSSTLQNWLPIQGTYGEFCAPGSESPVSYLLTHASLGKGGTGNTQLTKYLVPMRELFDVGELRFDELLQRDLDDHRVASEIIPYLLKQGPSARFFPPILAVILPVDGRVALEKYPAKDPKEAPEKDELGRETGFTKVTNGFGRVFEYDRFRDKYDTFSHEAHLRINPDQAKIVVLDGQHRAMAILAIRRSQTGDWGDRGADYKHFYEDIAIDLKNNDVLKGLDRIEMPVCLAFLPEVSANGAAQSTSLVKAFRKLFLDVNKEARKPTRARQLLLDDSNIISVLSRSILTSVRNQGQQTGTTSYAIDLDSFEYDSPRESPKPQRDLALCTIEMVYELVRWALFADDEYYVNPAKLPTVGRSVTNLRRFLSEINADEKISSNEIRGWGFTELENELSPSDVPSVCHAKLSELFMEGWGNQIAHLLSSLHPMKAHIESVAILRIEHRSETGHGQLAWRALFDGQGIYWTMKKYTEHRRAQDKKLPITDVEKAYEAITKNWIPKEFEPVRAKKYYKISGNLSGEQLGIANRSFLIFRTMAFQIGFTMAIALLKKELAIKDPACLATAVEEWISAWNYAFMLHPKSERGKKSLSMFDPDGDGLMGRHFGRLQKGEWIWFRYFAFEMLNAVSSEVEFQGKDIVARSIDKMRKKYIQKLGDKIRNDEKRKGDELSTEKAIRKAADIWRETLNFSLGLKKKDFEMWRKKIDLPLDSFNGNEEETEDVFSDSGNGLVDGEMDDEFKL